MFVILGVICLILMGLAALYVRNPPEGYAPEGWTPKAATGASAAPARAHLDWKAMIRRPLFWLLFAAYFCGVFAGILVNGLAAPIAIELAGFSRAEAPLAVMLFAVASAGGRALWGFLSDRLGRVFMVAAAFVLTAIAMFAMHRYVTVPGAFLPCIAAAGLCYGGVFGTFPSLCADSFGTKHAAVNLAVLFVSFSLVAIIAPQVVGMYRAAGAGEFPKAFLVAGCIAVAGFVLSIIMGRAAAKAMNDAV
jgi:OFA family oxalate/formate antiporter-like MFS transporter